MSEIYLYNLVKSWLEVKRLFAEARDEHSLNQVAWYERQIEDLVNQIERERWRKAHPGY